MNAVAVPGAAVGPTTDDFRRLFLDDVPLIDTRAPVEFAKGAFPTSVNLPLMTDEERHAVGTRYKRAGQQAAIELGATLVGEDGRRERTARWKAFAEDHPDGALYCFRGGLRSRITQAWLRDAGTDYPLVVGGYKALRQFLIGELERLCGTLPFVLVAGRTGSGKTLLVNRIARSVDLEGVAHHRGSSFGGMAGPQPKNIDFENRVAIELMKLEAALPADADAPVRTVFLEDESKLIGRVCLPPVLQAAMKASDAVVLETPLDERVANCMDDYVSDLLARFVARDGPEAGFDAYAEHHRSSLSRIVKRLGADRYRVASTLLEEALVAHRERDDASGYPPFIELLLTDYYDPMYDYQSSTKARRTLFAGSADAILDWIGSGGLRRARAPGTADETAAPS